MSSVLLCILPKIQALYKYILLSKGSLIRNKNLSYASLTF